MDKLRRKFIELLLKSEDFDENINQYILFNKIFEDTLKLVKDGIVQGVYKRDWNYYHQNLRELPENKKIEIPEFLLGWIVCTALMEGQMRGVLEPIADKIKFNVHSKPIFTDEISSFKNHVNNMNRRFQKMTGKKISKAQLKRYNAIETIKNDFHSREGIQLSDAQAVQKYSMTKHLTVSQESKLYNAFQAYKLRRAKNEMRNKR